ncbi:MAG: L-histidine N(alpha)-methyltransferase, partial [Pseudomonadota bacterium]
GAQFLLGVDLEKDEKILNTAYNDAAGVTAAFNLNLLYRMRRELDADISVEDFEHHAFYNARETRIEMHLRARVATDIVIDAMSFHFEAGETLHTENSYKYSRARLADLLRETPWKLDKIWTDQQGWYAACLLSHR